MKSLRLNSFRLQNFKAVQDSGVVHFTPLTVFIGNNGSGKSSLIEGLKAFRDISEDDLVEVIQAWHGYSNIRYRGRRHKSTTPMKNVKASNREHPISFAATGQYEYGPYAVKMEIGLGPQKEALISREEIKVGRHLQYTRNARGVVRFKGRAPAQFGTVKLEPTIRMDGSVSIIGEIDYLDKIVSDWQFAFLDPVAMSEPALRYQYRSNAQTQLTEDGANIAEYLFDIRNIDKSAFEGIVDTLKYILPYAQHLEPSLASGLDQMIYIQMTEGKFKVPAWLLSTGTLRLIGILALLRHPQPPPFIVFEELENSLDPRSLSLIIEEIRNALLAGKTQVVATTHSPYLLDLLDLSEIVVVERSDGGQPTFIRPDQASLREWSKKFSPGQLYTMNALGHKGNP
jgi:predicted ATPase